MVLTKNNDQYGVVFDNRGNPEYMVFETTTKSYSKKWFISFEKRNLENQMLFLNEIADDLQTRKRNGNLARWVVKDADMWILRQIINETEWAYMSENRRGWQALAVLDIALYHDKKVRTLCTDPFPGMALMIHSYLVGHPELSLPNVLLIQ